MRDTSLYSAVQHLLALGSASPDVGELVKLILKTFWSATYMYIPAPLAHPQQFAPWMTALHTFILAPVPTVPLMQHRRSAPHPPPPQNRRARGRHERRPNMVIKAKIDRTLASQCTCDQFRRLPSLSGQASGMAYGTYFRSTDVCSPDRTFKYLPTESNDGLQEGEPEGSLRASWSWWKAKKWALHISHRLFNR